jgi:hypothetical protein
VLKAASKELLALYWDTGRLIIERSQGDRWGKSVVKNLARDLQAEFPGTGGFSAGNLWRMRLFYETTLATKTRTIGARKWLVS